MMIRRYIVKDMPEAVMLIRRELGKDAVILNSKRITVKKWLGLWRYKRLEVLAATGDDIPVRVTPAKPSAPSVGSPVERVDATSSSYPTSFGLDARTSYNSFEPLHAAPVHSAMTFPAQSAPIEPEVQQAPPTVIPVDATNRGMDEVKKQIEEVKRMLQSSVVPSTLRPPIVQQLIQQGLDETYVTQFFESVSEMAASQDGNDDAPKPKLRDQFIQYVSRELEDLLQSQPINPTSRVVLVVGPTGVGKTTSIAKLAALHVLAGNRKVGLLTTDTFRIAAVEQLKTYASILNVPLEVVYQPSEMQAALDRLADRDLILIDTAGRNFRMDIHLEELRDLMSGVQVDETYLVLSVASKPDDLNALASVFSELPFDKFLFTKLDETSTYGAVLNLVHTYRKPLSYLSTGQNVPDDIEVASLEKILRLILGGAA